MYDPMSDFSHDFLRDLAAGSAPADPLDPEPAGAPQRPVRAEPARVIEVGEVTAGIAVPEGRGVRFFSSARAFDGLDGAVFSSAEQVARAARARALGRDGQPRLRGA